MSVVLVLLSGASYRDREIKGPRLCGLLALLADDLRAGCGTARLVESLWPDERPENPIKALHVLVSRARALLGTDAIAATPTGYRLVLREDQVDACAVVLCDSAGGRLSRAGEHAAALAQAEAGIALWQGAASPPEAAGDPLSDLRAARAMTLRSLVRTRALALARLGRHAEAVEPLRALLPERSLDEEVLAELLRCEAATMGPSKALARYDAYRSALREELGGGPGPALQAVHNELLHSDIPVVRHGVSHEPNLLVGRDDDIAAVTGLLRASRVASIVGAGGLGKTRLAHAVAREARQPVVYFVPLANITGDGEVVTEVASVLGVATAGRTGVASLALPADLLTGIVNTLGPGPALLVLDNCEHVLRGAAALVHRLVAMSGSVRVLTTSRAPLGLSSESVFALPELSLATAAELFCHRARSARPSVALPADVVEQVCAHLDGLPLAVELAAARVRVMSVGEIARRLDDRFTLLRGGIRDAPPRHHTLHAVIDWSWNLLEPAGQVAMRALSVFPAGFTAEAARQLLGDDDVLRMLELLVEQSLVKVTDTPAGTRFRMLETIREFSTAQRRTAGETDQVTDRFLAWARDFGIAHHLSIYGEDLVPSGRIRAEQDNLMLALRYGLDRRDGATVAATCAVLAGLWSLEVYFARSASLSGEPAWVLSHFQPGPDLVETTRMALVLITLSAFIRRGVHASRTLVALRRLPPAPPDAPGGVMDKVIKALTETSWPGLTALRALSDSDDPLLAGLACGAASYVLLYHHDGPGALGAARRALALLEQQASPMLIGLAHSRIGEVSMALGLGEEARRRVIATLPVMEEAGARFTVARLRIMLMVTHLMCGATDEAEHLLAQMAPGEEAASSPMVESLVRAEILLARGQIEAGLSLLRRAADQLGNRHIPASDSELLGGDSWTFHVQAVTVVAHAQHGRLDLVEEIVDCLPDALSRVIAGATDLSLCGALILALAATDIDKGRRNGDAHVVSSAARMIALAERLGFQQEFQPTMSPERARQTAELADESAYADSRSAYAGLGSDELMAAALEALRARPRLIGQDHA